jgi:hypothetical protein
MSKINKDFSIFTTGAYLKAVKVRDGHGKECWVWVVSRFEDDSFLCGDVCKPREEAQTKEGLIVAETEEN